MLNQVTAAEVMATTRTLSQLDGNCGRKYRRFLGRLLEGTEGHIHLVFATGGDTPPVFRAKKAYAEHCLSLLRDDFDLVASSHLSIVGLTATAKTGDIRMTFKVNLDVETASLLSLRGLCHDVQSIASSVVRYEEAPTARAEDFVEAEKLAKKRRAQMEQHQARMLVHRMGSLQA